MAVEPTVLSEPDPEEADSLVSSNDPDDMQNEQTWPTEEEMQDDPSREPAEGTQLPDAAPGTTPRVVRRVPKGTSEYQAAWIIEEDDKEDAGIGEGDEGAQNGNAEELVEVPVPDNLEDEMEVEAQGGKDVEFQDLEEEEENRQSVGLPFRSSFLTQSKGWRVGADGSEKNETTESFLMRSIHPKTPRRGSGFNGTVGCDPSALARGIPTRTCREIMREYSSSRISSGLNVRFADARKKKAAQYRSVHHVQTGRPAWIPDIALSIRLGPG